MEGTINSVLVFSGILIDKCMLDNHIEFFSVITACVSVDLLELFVIKHHHHHNHSLFLCIITVLLKVTPVNEQENLGIFVFRITLLEIKIEEEYFPLYQESLDDKILSYCCF
jgi:hypothetical protein